MPSSSCGWKREGEGKTEVRWCECLCQEKITYATPITHTAIHGSAPATSPPSSHDINLYSRPFRIPLSSSSTSSSSSPPSFASSMRPLLVCLSLSSLSAPCLVPLQSAYLKRSDNVLLHLLNECGEGIKRRGRGGEDKGVKDGGGGQTCMRVDVSVCTFDCRGKSRRGGGGGSRGGYEGVKRGQEEEKEMMKTPST